MNATLILSGSCAGSETRAFEFNRKGCYCLSHSELYPLESIITLGNLCTYLLFLITGKSLKLCWQDCFNLMIDPEKNQRNKFYGPDMSCYHLMTYIK